MDASCRCEVDKSSYTEHLVTTVADGNNTPVSIGFAPKHAPHPSDSSCFLSTLPIALRGNESTRRTSRGRLCTESCWATY